MSEEVGDSITALKINDLEKAIIRGHRNGEIPRGVSRSTKGPAMPGFLFVHQRGDSITTFNFKDLQKAITLGQRDSLDPVPESADSVVPRSP